MLKQRFLLQFGSSVIVQAVGMLAGIIVARLAGPGVVGVVAYGTAYVSILGFILGLFGPAHIKLVSEGRDHADCRAVFARLQGASSLVYLVAMLGWFGIQKFILRYPFESGEVQAVILLTLAAHFFSIYESYSSIIFTAKLKQAKANIPHLFKTLAWHMGRIAIVLIGWKALAIQLSAWSLLLALAFVPMISRLLKEYPLGRYDPILAKEYFRYSLPILIGAIVGSITRYADKLLLAYFSDTTQLGYYSAAYAIGGMFLLISVPVGNIFFPLFSTLIAKGNWTGVNANIRKYQEFIILFVLPLICALAVAGGPGLTLVLGKRYEPSVMPFVILIISTYVVLMGLPYGNILSGMGRFGLAAWIDGILLVVFIISVSVFLSPKLLGLGATGLALNQLTLNLARNAMFLVLAKKLGKVILDRRNAIRQIVIIAIALLAYWISGYARQWTDIWWLLFLPGLLVSTYLILITTGLLGKEHWVLLLEALNVKKTFRYASDEIRGREQDHPPEP